MVARDLRSVSYSWFCNTWKEKYPSFRIRSGKRANTCPVCGAFKTKLMKERDPAVRARLESQRAEHYAMVRDEKHRYHYRQKLAMDYPHLFLSLIIDGMAQVWNSIPNLGDAQHAAKQVPVKIIGAITHGHRPHRRAFLSTIHTGDTNTYCQVLLDVLTDVCGGDFSKLPPVIFIQLDNTSSTNKNNIQLAVSAFLVEAGITSQVI